MLFVSPRCNQVVGAVVLDKYHLTTDQLLAKTREFHARLPKS